MAKTRAEMLDRLYEIGQKNAGKLEEILRDMSNFLSRDDFEEFMEQYGYASEDEDEDEPDE